MLQKMKSCLKGKKQKGISLLEVLLSLTIISVILVMATRYYFEASENTQATDSGQMLVHLATTLDAQAESAGATPTALELHDQYGFLPNRWNGTEYTTALNNAVITITKANASTAGKIQVDDLGNGCLRVLPMVKGAYDDSACNSGALTVNLHSFARGKT